MEQSKETLSKSFHENFLLISPEEQFKALSVILSSNSYLRWRTKSLLNSIETPDFLTLLPPEIQLIILSYVDGCSLMKACAVSKKWNKLINSFYNLWKQKSIEMGVNIKDKPAHIPWPKAFTSSKKQLNHLQSEKAFLGKYINLQDSNSTVKVIDYHDGYICTVSKDDFVSIWHLALNVPVLSFNVINTVSCVKFCPYSTLVCGHLSGILSSWDLSDMNIYCLKHYGYKTVSSRYNEPNFAEFSLLKVKYKMHSGPVFTCDFSDKFDLLISGGGDGTIKFWCLRTGENLYSIYGQIHWVLKVCLIVTPSTNSHILLAMTKDTIEKYEWPSDQLRNQFSSLDSTGEDYSLILNKMKNTASIKFHEFEDVFVVPGFQINNKFIGLVLQDLQEKQSTFNLYNLDKFNRKVSVPLNFKVRKFLALGDRFALFLSTSKELYMSTLVTVDIFNGKVIGTHSIPHTKMTTPDSAQLVVGDTRWLDGLRGWEFFEDKMSTLYNDPIRVEKDKNINLETISSPEGVNSDISSNDSDSSPPNFSYLNIVKEELSGRICDSLVLATGLQLQEGTFFTLWWGIDKENKTKVD